QALQCTQLAALICKRRVPSSFLSISYTAAGQNRVQGLPYSRAQRSAQMLVSCTCRCTGCCSSWAVEARYTAAVRSRGASDCSGGRGGSSARGDSVSSNLRVRSLAACLSVQG